MILQHLAARAGTVTGLHGPRPDAPRHPAHHRVFRVHTVGKEEAEIRHKVIHLHTPGQVVLHQGKPVGQGKCQLGNRVGPRLGNVIPTHRHAVIVANIVFDEKSLHVAHHGQGKTGGKNTGILGLILLENISLHGAAH